MIREYTAPDGAKIIGTLQSVECVALIEGVEHTTNDPIYTGDSKIRWESMQTLRRKASPIYIDENGNEWTFTQLVPVPVAPSTDRRIASNR